MRPSRLAVVGLFVFALTACSKDTADSPKSGNVTPAPAPAPPTNVYADAGLGALSPAASKARSLVYVPNTKSNSVSVIDPATHTVIRTFRTGRLPQHVVPSWDMTTLWVTNDEGDSLTRVDPVTGMDGARVPVDDPYNMYFTPDGTQAVVMAEALHRFDFRDASTMKLVESVPVKCGGLDHMDYTMDRRFGIATCEFSGQLVKIDIAARKVVGYLTLSRPAMPQDIRLAADGRVMFVADMMADGVRVIDPESFTEVGFVKMGKGTHGIVVSRDGQTFYVSNRGWNTTAGGRRGPGSISVLDTRTRTVRATWPIPGGGSPDMGGLSADGKELWLSGRYDDEVYAIDTTTGALNARIKVGAQPHGLCVWPQPGRVSFGHTGNMR